MENLLYLPKAIIVSTGIAAIAVTLFANLQMAPIEQPKKPALIPQHMVIQKAPVLMAVVSCNTCHAAPTAQELE